MSRDIIVTGKWRCMRGEDDNSCSINAVLYFQNESVSYRYCHSDRIVRPVPMWTIPESNRDT